MMLSGRRQLTGPKQAIMMGDGRLCYQGGFYKMLRCPDR